LALRRQLTSAGRTAEAPSRRCATATDSAAFEAYYETRHDLGALIEAIDLAQLASSTPSLRARNPRHHQRIIAIKAIVMSIAEQEELLDDICNDVGSAYGRSSPCSLATTSPTSW